MVISVTRTERASIDVPASVDVIDRAALADNAIFAGMNIGLGGIAKGYAVDRAMLMLRQRGFDDALVNGGLVYDGAKAFVTPRRLTLAVHGLPAKQPDLKEEKKGPRVGARGVALGR